MGTITPRRNADRGASEYGGWLSSKFTFSFADYSDARYDSFGVLRVLNDDTVKSGGGFPTHSHRDFEIFSYILAGQLEHKDSMQNSETLSRGHVQFTSAGTGISHSEFNGDRTPNGKGADVRFLQIWAVPSVRGLKPAYQTGFFPDERKRNALCPILQPAARRAADSGALGINNNLTMLASILSPGASVSLPLEGSHKAYVHLPIMPGSAGVAVSSPGLPDVLLQPGDGAFVEGVQALGFKGLGEAGAATEFVVMHF